MLMLNQYLFGTHVRKAHIIWMYWKMSKMIPSIASTWIANEKALIVL